jgi:hypothetical protein
MKTRKNLLSRLAALAVGNALVLAAGTVSASATTVFSDGDFANVTATSIFTSGGSTGSISQCATCGTSSGFAIGVVVDTTGSAGTTTTAAGAIENAFSYDPTTQGAITSIDASVDKDFIVTTSSPTTYQSVFRPMILQSGNYYLATIPIGPVAAPGDSGYITASQNGLTADDFTLYSFVTGIASAAHPDFGGGPLQFGLATVAPLASGTTANINFDNLRFQVNSVAPTPIPGTLPLLATGLAAMGMVARRRNRKSA